MTERNSQIFRESSFRRKKTSSVYHYRRRSKVAISEQYVASLKHVIGLTLKSNCSFSCNVNSGLLAYPAGGVIVLHNPRSNAQSHIFNPGQKTLTCLHFSSDGNYIVTGEAGHQPCVRVFSVNDRCHVTSFLSHKFGISCVAFSPNGKYVISIGYQHDNVINVWDWKKDILAASNKVSTKVKAVAFSQDSSYFVTVGNRHVKFWYLENSSDDITTIPLKGRSAILETLRNHVFCDVICGVGDESQYTYAVTRSGILCQFNAGRTVEKYVELKSGNARTVTVMNEMILCGCAGSVLVFNATSLEFISEIFPPSQVRNNHIVAMAIDVRNMWMHCVFSDHSLLVYDMAFDSPRIHSLFLFHGACVWDIKVVPSTSDCDSLPKNCFLTCSNDGTARAWQCIENECNLSKVIKLDESSDGGSDETSVKYEARSLCIRYDAKHLAVGDRAGNIHIYNLETFEKLAFIPTHEGDILCMDYSPSGDILASASRDRCVHTFDRCYAPTHTIADHSAAVTSVKFSRHENDFRLVTCGSDKSLYFCLITSSGDKTEVSREQHFVEKHSMSDMAILDDSVLVACGWSLSEYDVTSAKLRRSFRGSETTSTILRVAVNSHKTLVATSCTDKHINILGYSSTECLCIMGGHSEVALALTFDLEDRLLSASADSCVFVWNLKRRTSEDNLHLLSTNIMSSAVSTPDSPELDRTTYFGSDGLMIPELEEGAKEDEETPRSLNGESVPSLLPSDFIPANDNLEKFEAISANTWSPRIFDLPRRIVGNLPTESSLEPQFSRGKWRDRLDHEKVCEEIENLAKFSDVHSIISSIDGEELASVSEDSLEGTPTATGVASSEMLFDFNPPTSHQAANSNEKTNSHDSDDVNKALCDETNNETRDRASTLESTTSVDTVKSLPNETPPSVKMPANGCADAVADEPIKSVDLDAEVSNFDNEETPTDSSVTDTRPLSARYFQTNQAIDESFMSGKRNSLSLQDELINSFEGVSDSPVQSKSLPVDVTVSSEVNGTAPALTPERILPPESERQDHFDEVVLTDEEVDVRRLHYMNPRPDSGTSRPEIAATKEDAIPYLETDLRKKLNNHSTPVTLTSKLTIRLNAGDSISDESTPKMKLQTEEDEALETVSSTLVDQVLNCVGEAPEHEQPSHPDQPTPDTVVAEHPDRSDSSDSDASLSPGDDDDDDDHNENAPKVAIEGSTCSASNPTDSTSCNQPASNVKVETSENAVDEEKSHTNKEPFQQKKNDNLALPPAFRDLLESLTKKRSPRVHPKTSARQSQSEHNLRRVEPAVTTPHQSVRSPHEPENHLISNCAEGSLQDARQGFGRTTRCNAGHPATTDDESAGVLGEDLHECQKAGDRLVAAFEHAKTLYNKHKTNHEVSVAKTTNNSCNGFRRLVHSFQIVHDGLNRIKTFNSVHPIETNHSETNLIESLSTDSPVYNNLLREYSDKLVDMVHMKLDQKNTVLSEENG